MSRIEKRMEKKKIDEGRLEKLGEGGEKLKVGLKRKPSFVQAKRRGGGWG